MHRLLPVSFFLAKALNKVTATLRLEQPRTTQQENCQTYIPYYTKLRWVPFKMRFIKIDLIKAKKCILKCTN